MQKSESIKELSTALSKSQSELRAAKKESSNPFFHSKYADLTSIWESAREPLTKNGLAVIQTLEVLETKELTFVNALRTTLTHSSGEWISSVVVLNPVKNDPQGMGSCISYYRRYALSAMIGITAEDDDGNAATHQAPPAKVAPPVKSWAQKPAPKPAPQKTVASNQNLPGW